MRYAIPKTVRLNKKQLKYFDSNCIDFSKWVRTKIEEEIKENG